jgi:hypothetical protein
MGAVVALHATRKIERRQRPSDRQAFRRDHLMADPAEPPFIQRSAEHDPAKKGCYETKPHLKSNGKVYWYGCFPAASGFGPKSLRGHRCCLSRAFWSPGQGA